MPDSEGEPSVDILTSLKDVTRLVQSVLDKYAGDVNDLSGMTKAGGLDAVVADAVVDANLKKALAGVRSQVDLFLAQGALPKRDDLIKLLEDPLTAETRTTRRNVGLLTALAFLLGAGGRSPDSFLGVGMTKFPAVAFPLLVGAVLVYEFWAFRLYAATDIARRAIHESRAVWYLNALKSEATRFRLLLSPLEKLVAKSGPEPAGAPLKVTAGALLKEWSARVEAFGADLALQRRRRWWDHRMPYVLVAVSALSLLSMLPTVRLWLWHLLY